MDLHSYVFSHAPFSFIKSEQFLHNEIFLDVWGFYHQIKLFNLEAIQGSPCDMLTLLAWSLDQSSPFIQKMCSMNKTEHYMLT